VISDKNIGELEDLVHLAESLGVRISFVAPPSNSRADRQEGLG